jgi:uncharacterized protein
MYFPISGVHVFPLVPFGTALVISLFASMGGLSGAFLLLPFQVSILGFSSPAVTPTNHLFNAVAIPSGVYRYIREKRMVWPLVLIILLGTIPGVVIGSVARIRYLYDPRRFKLFVGFVLLIIGSRLVKKVRSRAQKQVSDPGAFAVKTRRFDLARLEYEFADQIHSVSTPLLFLLTLAIGVIGGAYGVGGGAIISPLLISMFHLPVHTIAGATLCGTCVTSFVGVIFFSVAQPLLGIPGVAPDWLLGGIFGLGGLVGMYSGARLQKHFSSRIIEAILALVVMGLAASYIVGYFF